MPHDGTRVHGNALYYHLIFDCLVPCHTTAMMRLHYNVIRRRSIGCVPSMSSLTALQVDCNSTSIRSHQIALCYSLTTYHIGQFCNTVWLGGWEVGGLRFKLDLQPLPVPKTMPSRPCLGPTLLYPQHAGPSKHATTCNICLEIAAESLCCPVPPQADELASKPWHGAHITEIEGSRIISHSP